MNILLCQVPCIQLHGIQNYEKLQNNSSKTNPAPLKIHTYK